MAGEGTLIDLQARPENVIFLAGLISAGKMMPTAALLLSLQILRSCMVLLRYCAWQQQALMHGTGVNELLVPDLRGYT